MSVSRRRCPPRCGSGPPTEGHRNQLGRSDLRRRAAVGHREGDDGRGLERHVERAVPEHAAPRSSPGASRVGHRRQGDRPPPSSSTRSRRRPDSVRCRRNTGGARVDSSCATYPQAPVQQAPAPQQQTAPQEQWNAPGPQHSSWEPAPAPYRRRLLPLPRHRPPHRRRGFRSSRGSPFPYRAEFHSTRRRSVIVIRRRRVRRRPWSGPSSRREPRPGRCCAAAGRRPLRRRARRPRRSRRPPGIRRCRRRPRPAVAWISGGNWTMCELFITANATTGRIAGNTDCETPTIEAELACSCGGTASISGSGSTRSPCPCRNRRSHR